MTISLMMFDAPIGPLALCARGDQLVGVYLPGHPVPQHRVARTSVLVETAAQLAAYFAGTRTHFELPLAPAGTAFQRRVWEQLLAIPHGETWSYGEVARAIGRPAASRAVGGANGKNPIAVVIPCHRVIGVHGTGYGGGIQRWLLQHEQLHAVVRPIVRPPARDDVRSE